MKRLNTIFAAFFLTTTGADAAPLCSEFLSAETMPKKYKKLGPVLSGGINDWIITNDQMDVDYAPSQEAAQLLAEVVDEFERRGTRLAIMVPPPRPLIAGQKTLEALEGRLDNFDVETVSTSFHQMVGAAQEAGAIVPNLLDLATSDNGLRDIYYYKHDTHWTPQGAATSAVALAEAVLASDIPTFKNVELTGPQSGGNEVFSERGSLADMAKAVCGVEIVPVEQEIPSFETANLGLLDDVSVRPNIVLAGSSFSNRYKKDAYRVADAIAGALNANIANHSVSGGGAIGAIEGVVNAGLLDAQNPVDLVVWEIPYTQGLKSIGMYRQLLGALQFKQGETAARSAKLDATGETKIMLDGLTPKRMAFYLPDTKLERIKVDLRFADGSKQTLGLVRKKHVPVALQSDWWAVSLAGLDERKLVSITARYGAGKAGSMSKIHLY